MVHEKLRKLYVSLNESGYILLEIFLTTLL